MEDLHPRIGVAPGVAEGFADQGAKVGKHLPMFEQARAGRDQKPDGVLDRIHGLDQVLGLDEVEERREIFQSRPRREGNQRRTQGDPRPAHCLQNLKDILHAMPLFQDRQHPLAQRFHGRDDEEAAEDRELGKEIPVFSRGELPVHGAEDFQRVAGAVQEIGIAEADVGCSLPDLLSDVLHDDLARHDKEPPSVDGRNGAVAAEMQATATRLDVSGYSPGTSHLEGGIPGEGGQGLATGQSERKAGEDGAGPTPLRTHDGKGLLGRGFERPSQVR